MGGKSRVSIQTLTAPPTRDGRVHVRRRIGARRRCPVRIKPYTVGQNRRPLVGFLPPNDPYRRLELPPSRLRHLERWLDDLPRRLGEARMELEYDLRDGAAEVERLVRTTDVERPSVGAVLVCLRPEVERDGAVGYGEAGGRVFEATLLVRCHRHRHRAGQFPALTTIVCHHINCTIHFFGWF